MAPIKRKGNNPEDTSARQPQKRAKVGTEVQKKERKPQDTAPKASELSVLRDDEPSFPRGGGSILTPLERKQIQIQATKDVLFEQKGPKTSTREFDDNEDDEEEVDDIEMGETETTTAAKKSRKKKTKGNKSTEGSKSEKQGVRIESLSYKVCTVSKSFKEISQSALANPGSASFPGLWSSAKSRASTPMILPFLCQTTSLVLFL